MKCEEHQNRQFLLGLETSKFYLVFCWLKQVLVADVSGDTLSTKENRRSWVMLQIFMIKME